MANTTETTKIHKPKNPLLILEDTKENQDLLKGMCKKMGLACELAENGEIGMKFIEKDTFSIYIVDLMMPVMDGKTFIHNLKEQEPDAIILVQSAIDSSDTIIQIMKLGVFDYIIKPIDPELFEKTISKALELKHLRDMEKNITDNATLKVRNQLDWLNYKEDRRISGKDYAEIKSIYNLKTSLSQGTGFGSLLTMIDLIKSSKKDDGDNYALDKQLIDLLINNYNICKAQLDGLHSISKLLEDQFTVEESNSASLIAAIPEMLQDITPHFSKKNLQISLPEQNKNCILNLNMQKLGLLIEELVINAYKYATNDSTINIFSYIREGYFWISVMDRMKEGEPHGGIPQKYEKLVLEPFFRLLPPDETIGSVEKFGLGLGLTVADNIARKHGGMFMIHDVEDHSGGEASPCVLAEVMLPIID